MIHNTDRGRKKSQCSNVWGPLAWLDLQYYSVNPTLDDLSFNSAFSHIVHKWCTALRFIRRRWIAAPTAARGCMAQTRAGGLLIVLSTFNTLWHHYHQHSSFPVWRRPRDRRPTTLPHLPATCVEQSTTTIGARQTQRRSPTSEPHSTSSLTHARRSNQIHRRRRRRPLYKTVRGWKLPVNRRSTARHDARQLLRRRRPTKCCCYCCYCCCWQWWATN